MSWTHEDLAALNASITSGRKRVDYPGGHSIEYQTLNDMLKLRRSMILEINASQNIKPHAKVRFVE